MVATFEACLTKRGRNLPPIPISYPQDFDPDDKTTAEGQETISISTQPAYYSLAELQFIKEELAQKFPDQTLITTGTILVGDDPLLSLTHEQLTEYEQKNNLPSTEIAPGGGKRQEVRERVYVLREQELTNVLGGS